MADRTMALIVKLRSLKTANGSSGSFRCRDAWYTTNSASRTTPTAMIIGIVINPVTVPHS